jgi:hypothetical protein
MARNQQLRRMVTAAAIFAAMLAAAPGAMAAPSNPDEAAPTVEPAAVAQFVGEYSWVESRCDASVYPLCLYYNSNMDTAWWATTVRPELALCQARLGSRWPSPTPEHPVAHPDEERQLLRSDG